MQFEIENGQDMLIVCATALTLENFVSFRDMIILPQFQISHWDRLAKNVKSRCVQVIPRFTACFTNCINKLLSFQNERNSYFVAACRKK